MLKNLIAGNKKWISQSHIMDSGYPLFFYSSDLFPPDREGRGVALPYNIILAGKTHLFQVVSNNKLSQWESGPTEDKRSAGMTQSSILYHPSATSSIIINANPTANPIVPIFECFSLRSLRDQLLHDHVHHGTCSEGEKIRQDRSEDPV